MKLKNFLKAVLRILKRKNFILFMISYAFNRGAFYAIYILAGQLIKPTLPNEEDLDKKVGIAIMLLFVVGFAGSLLGGFLIDRPEPERHS